jgi:NADPH:quinone reductase-like Zn-dependent oxidoreductase
VEHLIDYRNANVEQEVRQLTRGRGVDVVLDPLGGKSFAASYRMLAPLGRLVVYGVSAAAPGPARNWLEVFRAWWSMPSFKPLSLLNRNRGVFGLHLGHLWSEQRRIAPLMTLLLEEVRSERLKPVVARAFPLQEAADAHRFIQSRSNIGKVVLVM